MAAHSFYLLLIETKPVLSWKNMATQQIILTVTWVMWQYMANQYQVSCTLVYCNLMKRPINNDRFLIHRMMQG